MNAANATIYTVNVEKTKRSRPQMGQAKIPILSLGYRHFMHLNVYFSCNIKILVYLTYPIGFIMKKKNVLNFFKISKTHKALLYCESTVSYLTMSQYSAASYLLGLFCFVFAGTRQSEGPLHTPDMNFTCDIFIYHIIIRPSLTWSRWC